MLEKPAPAGLTAPESTAGLWLPQVPLSIDAQRVAASRFARTQFQQQVCDLLSRGLPVSLTVTGLEQQPQAVELFRAACAVLASAAAGSAAAASGVEIVIPASAMPPNVAWSSRCEILGRGPLYLLAERRDMRTERAKHGKSRRFWEELWRYRTEPNLRLACAPLVRSHCPLLANELGATILPCSSIQVPKGSAWVVQAIDLLEFSNSIGVLDRTALATALQQSISLGIDAHTDTEWPTPQLRHDSWLNRRVVTVIYGIGDLVVRRRQDPCALACLANLRATLNWIRETLCKESKRIALADDLLPAISQINPEQSLGGDRKRWHARWSAAINDHASACRNLFVLSPWSVFPRVVDPEPAYLNLLPLLDFADACAFPEQPQLMNWNIRQFTQLYQCAAAVLARRDATQRFAEGV